MSTSAQKRKSGGALNANAQQASPKDNERDIKMKIYMVERSTQTDPDEPCQGVNNQLIFFDLLSQVITINFSQPSLLSQ
jgi:hypothetical protein